MLFLKESSFRQYFSSDVDDGGETVFPAAKGNISAVPWWNELSKCGKEGLSVLPKKRDALLFWNMRPDASLDPSSLHGEEIQQLKNSLLLSLRIIIIIISACI